MNGHRTQRLRIAHVTATYPPYRGGTGNVCYNNARELARRGHDVHVFTARQEPAARHERLEGVSVHRLSPLVRIGNAPVLPTLFTSLRGFDVLHLHYPFILGAEMVRAASLVHRTPLVVSFHNDLIGNGARAAVFSLYQRASAHLTVRGAACLCAVSLDHFQSSALCRSLAKHEPRTVELPNGVDTTLFRPTTPAESRAFRQKNGVPDHARLILFVAALDRAHHFKGLSILLHALAALPQDTWLLIVGDGELRDDYQREAAQLGIADRTMFAGSIAHEDTVPYFANADVTVLPSAPPESFGLVLVESLACETPVIASDIPGVRTVVSHGEDGFLFPQGNVSGLTQTLERLLSTPEDGRRAMGQAGRRNVQQRYSWPALGEQLEHIYRSVCLS